MAALPENKGGGCEHSSFVFSCLSLPLPSYRYHDSFERIDRIVRRYKELASGRQSLFAKRSLSTLIEKLIDTGESALLRHLIRGLPEIAACPRFGSHLLLYAIRKCQATAASILGNAAGKLINSPVETEAIASTYMHQAVLTKDLATVTEVLILPELNRDARDGLGRTALDVANFVCYQNRGATAAARSASALVVDFLKRYGVRDANAIMARETTRIEIEAIGKNLVRCLMPLIHKALSDNPSITPQALGPIIYEGYGITPSENYLVKLLKVAQAKE